MYLSYVTLSSYFCLDGWYWAVIAVFPSPVHDEKQTKKPLEAIGRTKEANDPVWGTTIRLNHAARRSISKEVTGRRRQAPEAIDGPHLRPCYRPVIFSRFSG
jgi:hypothetical protein